MYGGLQEHAGFTTRLRCRVIFEDNVQIGEYVMIGGPAVKEGEELLFTIPEGTVIPDGAIITDEESLQAVLDAQ